MNDEYWQLQFLHTVYFVSGKKVNCAVITDIVERFRLEVLFVLNFECPERKTCIGKNKVETGGITGSQGKRYRFSDLDAVGIEPAMNIYILAIDLNKNNS